MPGESGKIKVLIVDDDAFLASIYATKLELENFEVARARDGEEGLELAQQEKPDLILLDVLMPKLDGFEVLKRLKAMDGFKDTPVIMLTNLGQKEDIEQALAEGAADYLIKAHFVPAEAVDKIKKVLKME
jgi:DNA-binding response OmpR family regulator